MAGAMGASKKLKLLEESNSITWLVLLSCSIYPFEFWIYGGSLKQ